MNSCGYKHHHFPLCKLLRSLLNLIKRKQSPSKRRHIFFLCYIIIRRNSQKIDISSFWRLNKCLFIEIYVLIFMVFFLELCNEFLRFGIAIRENQGYCSGFTRLGLDLYGELNFGASVLRVGIVLLYKSHKMQIILTVIPTGFRIRVQGRFPIFIQGL